MPSSDATLVLDIGGTKIAYGYIIDADPTRVHARGEIPSQPPGISPVDQVRRALHDAHESARTAGITPVRVGIGAPGIVDAPRGLIRYAGLTMPGWAGTDLATLTDLPLACHNDVRIMAYGEYTHGAGATVGGRILFLALGTGVGGALIDNGHLLPGSTGSAGEASELRCSDFQGFTVRCENSASGTGLTTYCNEITRRAAEMGDASVMPPPAPVEWRPPQPGDISLRDFIAQSDDYPLAQSVIEGNLQGFGEAIGALASFLDINAVILGGGVSTVGALILDPFREGFRAAALEPNKTIPVIPAQLSTDAPLIGAAQYARDNT